jgi:aldehyde:ferredoxin oxidoreductase
LVTGDKKTEAQLDKDAERVVTLLRALTVRSMGTTDMRNQHDNTNEWITKADKDKPQFTPGTIQMEKADLELGRTMVYKQFGWDEKTGAPTKATLVALGMADVAQQLGAKGLLPS